jgi:hypothetical protein
MDIIRHQRSKTLDPRIEALWIYFLLAPSKGEPEDDGSFFIGNVGNGPEKNWTREQTPYSPAQPKATPK